MFEVKWGMGNNEYTHFTALDESSAIKWLHPLASLGRGLVADDKAFSESHSHLLTPFTKSHLQRMRATYIALYLRMRAFNNAISSQRITVERAFGILVRRFRCFRSAFELVESINHKGFRVTRDEAS